MGPGRLIIICGLPGAGKTTLAESLEQELGGVRLSPDDWMVALGIDIWDQEFRVRAEALQWELAQRLLQLGLTDVIEWGVWSRRERDELRASARKRGAAVELRYLDVPVDALWDRVRSRDRETHVGRRAITRADLAQWAELFEPPDADELELFDPPA